MDDHVCEGQLLFFSSFLEASLHYTTAMFVWADLNAVLNAGVEDKLSKSLKMLASFTVWLLWVLRCFEDAQKCLDNMVSMRTLNLDC